ncbi:MAG: hypothetical protein E6J67_22500, partial [Deltaproteobacteria bacterium]
MTTVATFAQGVARAEATRSVVAGSVFAQVRAAGAIAAVVSINSHGCVRERPERGSFRRESPASHLHVGCFAGPRLSVPALSAHRGRVATSATCRCAFRPGRSSPSLGRAAGRWCRRSRLADRTAVSAPVHGELERSAELSARGTDLDRPLGPAAGIVGGIDDRISAASKNIIEQYSSIGWFLFIRIFKTLALAPVQTLGSNVAVRDDLAPVQPAPMTKPRPEDPSDATMQTPSRLGKSSARPRVALALGFLAASVLARCSSAEKTTAGASGMVAAGSQHSVAIHPDGTLWAWGEDVFGQLGDGTTNTERLAPVQVGTDKNWALIAADERHSFAIKTDGTLWAWGSNGNFQLGDGTATDRSTPVQIGTDTHWAAVAAGDSHSLAIKTDGTLWAWGNNQFGQLGFPPTVVQTAPVQIGTDRNWTSVAAGGAHS